MGEGQRLYLDVLVDDSFHFRVHLLRKILHLVPQFLYFASLHRQHEDFGVLTVCGPLDVELVGLDLPLRAVSLLEEPILVLGQLLQLELVVVARYLHERVVLQEGIWLDLGLVLDLLVEVLVEHCAQPQRLVGDVATENGQFLVKLPSHIVVQVFAQKVA